MDASQRWGASYAVLLLHITHTPPTSHVAHPHSELTHAKLITDP